MKEGRGFLKDAFSKRVYDHCIPFDSLIVWQMFCGIVDGSRTAAVMLYDLRSTSGAVRKLRAAARQQQAIHSVCHTAEDELLCATMGGVWAWGGGTKSGDPGGTGAQEEAVAERLQIQVGGEVYDSLASSFKGVL